jgi:hypothetical protein
MRLSSWLTGAMSQTAPRTEPSCSRQPGPKRRQAPRRPAKSRLLPLRHPAARRLSCPRTRRAAGTHSALSRVHRPRCGFGCEVSLRRSVLRHGTRVAIFTPAALCWVDEQRSHYFGRRDYARHRRCRSGSAAQSFRRHPKLAAAVWGGSGAGYRDTGVIRWWTRASSAFPSAKAVRYLGLSADESL